MGRKQFAAAGYTSADAGGNRAIFTQISAPQDEFGVAMTGESAPVIDIDHPTAMVMNALQDPRWDWRTVEGIQQSTGIPPDVIQQVMQDYGSELDIIESAQHRILIRLKGRKETPKQRLLRTFDTILDVLSLGKRPIVHP
jgi:hypothetical protein